MKKRNNLHKFLNQNADIDDVLHSHAYRKVGKKTGPSLPAVKRPASLQRKAVPGYRDSLVGSSMQYKEKSPEAPKPDETSKSPVDEGVVGNRPRNDAHNKKNTNNSTLERRHHFIEPPKRNFNRFH